MKQLKDIINAVTVTEIYGDTDVAINAIQFDSRKVQPDDVFVAVKGVHADGHLYIDKAIEQGAAPAIKTGFAGDIKLAVSELGLTMLSAKNDEDLVSVQGDKNKISLNEISTPKGAVPDVVGMGAGDALYVLENAGLKVKLNGFRAVHKQSVLPGSPIMGVS